jgi:transglutaminase-like putative cysteine protease
VKKYRSILWTLLITSAGVSISGAQGDELSLFLKPTWFIDSDHRIIRQKAQELTARACSLSDTARALYEFVRDSYTNARCTPYVASDILRCGGNLCYQRSILLAALCRAAGIPSRLHLQKITIKSYRDSEGKTREITFAHGITGIFLKGRWRLYEAVGNRAKWYDWTGSEASDSVILLPFVAENDCLFQSNKDIFIETLPGYFADRTTAMVVCIDSLNGGVKY